MSVTPKNSESNILKFTTKVYCDTVRPSEMLYPQIFLLQNYWRMCPKSIQALSLARTVWSMKPFHYFLIQFRIYFCIIVFIFLMQISGHQIVFLLVRHFMTTQDGITISNETISSNCLLIHHYSRLDLYSVPFIISLNIGTVAGWPSGCKHSIRKSCCAQGHDQRDTLYVLLYTNFVE